MGEPVTADDLRRLLEKNVTSHAKASEEPAIWREPLLAAAKVDHRFDILPRIAAADHFLPQDLLASAKSVVVFFVPFAKALAVENHKGETPCRNWGLAYEATNRVINATCEQIQQLLARKGYAAELTPVTHNFDPVKIVSRWSHKHLGYIAGLGRFGVNAQLITPAGCAGRMGSLVTDAALEDSPLVREQELCLHKNGFQCLMCVKRCPVKAVSEAGIDRKRCWERLKSNRLNLVQLADLDGATLICGKCQVLVPCSLKAPKKQPPSNRT